MMLTDADGVVLSRMSGDHSLLQALDDVHLAPGFAYSERDVGTNGLGLALADRAPTLVRADQHYSLSLCTFTCAAVPVLDAGHRAAGGLRQPDHVVAVVERAAAGAGPVGGEQHRGADAGPVQRPPARARRRAARCSASRCRGWSRAPARVHELSESWNAAVAQRRAGDVGRAASSPPSANRARAGRRCSRRRRGTPTRGTASCRPARRAPSDVQTWLGLWTPELGKEHTAVIVRDVDLLPTWVAEQLRDLVVRPAGRCGAVRGDGRTLRGHPDRAGGSGRHRRRRCRRCGTGPTTCCRWPRTSPSGRGAATSSSARRPRGRCGTTTGRATSTSSPGWSPHAASRTDVIDVGSLPPEVLAGTSRHLSRIEAFERGEIIRVLSAPAARRWPRRPASSG